MHKLSARASLARLGLPVRRFAASSGPPAESQLILRNLPATTTADDVRRACEGVRKVRGVNVPPDRKTGGSRGFAFVAIGEADGEAFIRELDGLTLGGRQITVILTAPRAPAPTTSVGPPSGDWKASFPTNKLLVSSETASDVLKIFEAEGIEFNFFNLATSLHRLGVLSRTFESASRPLLDKLVQRAVWSIVNESKQWKSRNLANACWGIAKIGNVDAPALFDAVAAESPKKIASFRSEQLARTVWAYATAGFEALALFEAVAAEAPKKIETFLPQELANTVWAYATAGVKTPALFETVAAEASTKVAKFKPQELANTVWAYATARVEAPALFEAVAAEAQKNISAFTLQALANIVWAYATAGVESPALFEAVAAKASKRMETFTPQEKNISAFTPQDLANTVWAYSTAGVAAPALFEVIALRIKAEISEFSPDALSQLHQVYVHLQLEAPQHALTLLLSCHEAVLFAAYLRQEPSPSRSQRDVSAALSRVGWAHEFEHVTVEGISLAMAQPASKFAVEFDGPTHYLVGSSDGFPTRVLDGTSKFKERLLRRLGWNLVRVPYFAWDARSSVEREAYLCYAIDSLGASVS